MDRSNQAGPYFSNTWDYPVVAAINGIAPIIAGRDEGVVVWGYTEGGKFKYYGGIFEGVKGASPHSSSPLLTTRLEYNFWDPEPGYYSANAHYGDADNNSDVQLLDASVNYQFNEQLNEKSGRFIRPMDRSNQAGPYFSNTWDYPVVAAINGVAPIIAGRDEGVVVWGYTEGGKFKYYGGIFEGVKGASQHSSSPLLTTRLEYNFWDPEPGYYSANAHYGDANIFALGFNYHTQDNAVSADNKTDSVTTTSVDLLIEKVLGNEGVVTLEAAFYDYDYSELSALQGDAYLVSTSYLFPASSPSANRFQILARHQRFNHDDTIPSVVADSYNQRNEVGLNYIIKGHSAKLSLVYANEKIEGGDNNVLRFGVQLQTF
jgi:hypothetical protein